MTRDPDHSIADTSEAERYLQSFADVERGAIPDGGLTLDRTREILSALGEPHRRYPSVIIAGTNGKGSTAAMVERALRAAGIKTGLYTQPHLHTIRERIRIDGEPISPSSFDEGMAMVRDALDHVCDASSPTTAYEVMTSVAFERFAAENVGFAVLEVGLGGRLDSTNVADATASAITPISLDHTQILGDTIAAIAREKADVIKPGRVAVSAQQPSEALAVIQQTAGERGAPLWIAQESGARWDGAPHEWDLITRGGRLVNVRPALRGSFQRTNVAVAASILDALREAGIHALPLDAVRVGIEQAVWPGRFEIVPGEPPIVIDGAHNVAAAQALTEGLADAYPNARRIFVLGIAADKEVRGILEALLGGARTETTKGPPSLVIATQANHPRAVDPASIASAVRSLGAEALVSSTVSAALDIARGKAERGDVVVAAGSLYVVAEAREVLGLATSSNSAHFNPWASR